MPKFDPVLAVLIVSMALIIGTVTYLLHTHPYVAPKPETKQTTIVVLVDGASPRVVVGMSQSE